LQRINEAIKANNDARKEFPRDISLINLQGILLANIGKLRESLKFFKEALKIKNNDRDSLINLSACLVKLKEYKQALPLIEKILEKNPNDFVALSHKSVILTGLGRPKEGLRFAEKSIKLEPNYGSSWFSRAFTFLYLKKFEEALGNLLIATSLDNNVIRWVEEYPQFESIKNSKQWKHFIQLIKSRVPPHVGI